MTWAEFQLRLFAYKRECDRNDRNFREVAFAALWSFNVDGKKLPKSKQKFWPIGSEVKKVSKKALTAFERAMLQYKKEVSGKAKS